MTLNRIDPIVRKIGSAYDPDDLPRVVVAEIVDYFCGRDTVMGYVCVVDGKFKRFYW